MKHPAGAYYVFSVLCAKMWRVEPIELTLSASLALNVVVGALFMGELMMAKKTEAIASRAQLLAAAAVARERLDRGSVAALEAGHADSEAALKAARHDLAACVAVLAGEQSGQRQ